MKKKFTMFCLVVLMAFGIFGNMPAFQVQAETMTINSVRESVVVVAVCAEFDQGEQDWGYGTGFFVDHSGTEVQYLVTNNHVVDSYLSFGKGERVDATNSKYGGLPVFDGDGNVAGYMPGKMKIRVYYDSSDYDEAYVVDSDDVKDIALLRINTPTDKRKALTLLSPSDDMVGTDVYAIGYPGTSDNSYVDSVSKWEISDASITKGTLSRLITTSGTGVKRIQTDAMIQGGNSGGPMITEQGYVLGLNTESFAKTNGNTIGDAILSVEKDYYAVNIDEVIPMLKLHDVEYQLASGEAGEVMPGGEEEPASGEEEEPASSEEKGKMDDPQTNLGNTVEATETEMPDTPSDPTPSGLDVKIIAGAGAAVVLLVLVLVLVFARKKKSAPSGAGAGGGNRRPCVRSLSPQHNGASFYLNGGQILIGRNVASCAVVFKEGTPGISSRHCSISYEESSGCFILTDLKSTYGTFLAGGQKLTPGTPYRLNAGEQFYLGSDANLFRVEIE